MAHAWRRSAALVLALGKATELPRFLMVQRSAASKFMPGSHVFPGGLCDEADFSTDWMSLFAGYSGSKSGRLHELLLSAACGDVPAPSPLPAPVAHSSSSSRDGRPSPTSSEAIARGSHVGQQQQQQQPSATSQRLPPDLGLRITAIRETFEETGLLLACGIADDAACSAEAVDSESVRERLSAAARCRSRVQANASQFLDVCREHRLIPDVARLLPWSRWLTPAGHKSGRRYDTTFYLISGPAALAAEAVADSTAQYQQQQQQQRSTAASIGAEVVDIKVDHAGAIVRRYLERRLLVAPPQLYDLARLGTFGSLAELEKAAREREPLGLDLWAPVAVELHDGGRLYVLSGDDLYPATGKDSLPLHLNLSIDQAMKQYGLQNRMFSRKGEQLQISVNVPLARGQRAPLSLLHFASQFPDCSNL